MSAHELQRAPSASLFSTQVFAIKDRNLTDYNRDTRSQSSQET